VTGAQCFDQWFHRQPSRDRQAFCRRVGLRDHRPFVLYVCSALFKNSPSEAAFVARWLEALRRSDDPHVRDLAVLVRPHPQRTQEWDASTRAALERAGNAVLWGANPVDAESRADYFDSMYHAAAVVGLNTSALVEAAIVDRPVLTILLPEFRDNQEGTFHFHHLLTVGKGFLQASRTLDEHATQLARSLERGAGDANRAFVQQFIRPRGLAVPATPVFVDAVQQLAATERRRERTPFATFMLRPMIWALVIAGRVPWLERMYWNPLKSSLRMKTVAKQALDPAGLMRH
jgi:hypothetical protein